MENKIILDIIKKNLKSALIIFNKDKQLIFINDRAFDLLSSLSLKPNAFYKKIIENKLENSRNEIKIENVLIGYSIEFNENSDDNYNEVIIFQDITHIKQVEKNNNEKKQRELLGELAMYVAHEIKNSLNIIRGYSQLMLESHKISYIHNNLNIFIDETDRLNKLTHSILDYTKSGSLEFKKLNLIDFTKEFIGKTFANSKINLIIENENLEIFADRDKLIQLYINLIQNGLEAISNDGIFNLIIKKIESNKVEIIFETNGLIDEELDINHIFLKNYTSKKNGSGLGLSICKQIMEEHLGTIEACLNKYQGLSFILNFPLIFI